MLGSAFDIARSGLAAEALRLQTAAGNIANVSSTRVVGGNGEALSQTYVPQRVEQSSLGATGGVQATVQPADTPTGAPGPHVDLVREVTTLAQAQAAYEANLAVIVTVGEMTDSLLDIIGDRDSR